ncbi:MAG: oligosaccharide flippase family protein [Flavobacteriales bacterium]|nr:oligosaccharide flippase family protein [Flavobacteriales bacterium]
MSALRKLAGQTAIYGVSSIVARFLNFLLTPLYTSRGVFSPEEFGVITAFYAWAAFINVVLTFGMETTYFRFANRSGLDPKRSYATAFFSVAGLSLTYILACAMFPNAIAEAIRYPGKSDIVLMLAITLGLDAISALPMARLRLESRPWRFVAVNVLTVGVTVVLSLYFFAYAKRHDPTIGVAFVFAINLVASGVKFLVLVPKWPRPGAYDRALLRPMLLFAAPLAIAGLAGMVNETADRAMLKYLLPAGIADEQIGIYGACYKLAGLITLFIQAFRFAAEPFFFSHAERPEGRETFARVMNVFVAFCMAAFLVVMLFLDVFKWFIPNPAYHVGLRVVPILLLANVFLGIYYNQSVWYKVTDRTRWGGWIAVFGALVTIVLNVLLIPRIGFVGSAWATLACYAGMAIVSYLLGQWYWPVPYALGRLLLYMGGAVVLWLGVDATGLSGVAGYVLRGTVLVLALLMVWRLERPSILPTTR